MSAASKTVKNQDHVIADLSLAELQAFSPLVGEDVFGVLTLEGSLASRNHIGGTAPNQVRAAVARFRKKFLANMI